ncbi:hypothetical protein GL50803_008922 [Giardia duodenalis]|uniref:Uncharacterized protein n=1 Tax=Giardia intestinalis (strain ATCC 50803 / WB clone C6) TaxID=184922 RepID=A8BBT0_GIAIC|nr:hypothetical protein GL50803_008922 [Giardia intestinalis]KAE8305243.1 hypothetical protein GL50803_008922 [Giardia intestinalis]|eukprot:XP_001708057.1 Hypothetical protein GL50803_8922 [Giardia lamblia ATCC 50803]
MQLDAERCAVMSLLTKSLIETAKAGGGAIHILSGLPGIGKTYSIRSYLQPRVKQEGIEFCLLNCYAARTEVLTLQPRPQTVYVIDELDSLFAFTDQRTVDSLSPLKVLALSNPVLGLINDFTVELQSRISVFFGSSIKPHIHSFPAPSINELIAISQALFLDAELVADKATLTFLASQIVKHRHGDIRILVRTVQNLRVLAGTATKVGLKDVHEALNQALQRYKSHGMALELSEMEAKVLSVILDHCRESNGTISLLEIRRGYKVAMGVDIDIPEASIMTTLEILLSKGVIVDATRTNVQLEKSRLSHKRMKNTTATFSIHKSYRLNSTRYNSTLLRNACEAALVGSDKKAFAP